MKIAITSDLHLEHYGLEVFADFQTEFLRQFTEHNPDVLVLAGDIVSHGYEQRLELLLSGISLPPSRILAVSGNHDYYFGQEYGVSTLERYDGKLLTYLNRATTRIDSVTFGGCTNWYALEEHSGMNDETHIKGALWLSRHQSNLDYAWLNTCKDLDVLITHVPLIPEAINPIDSARHPELNRYYFQEMPDSRKPPAVCISGHTHHPINLCYDETRHISCPIGYPSRDRARNWITTIEA